MVLREDYQNRKLMTYEHRFETKTQGLVCGAPLLYGDSHIFQPLVARSDQFLLGDLSYCPTALLPQKFWKVVIRAREGGEVLWVRPYASMAEAALVYARAIGIDVDNIRAPIHLPTLWIDGELEYLFATVESWTANNTWNVPGGVSLADTLVVAGGGGGGYDSGGGGGAGGMKVSTGTSVSGSYTITIGPGGAARGSNGAPGTSGTGSSIGALVTTTGGGGGGSAGSVNGVTGGSGGGARLTGTGGSGTSGEGSAGGNGSSGGAGGGGKSAVGSTTGTATGGDGGAGLADSTTGSSVTYAAGGGGGANSSGFQGGAGGSSGVGGHGGDSTSNGGVTNPTANRGGGGGGGAPGSDGAAGFIAVSYNLAAGIVIKQNSFQHMLVR